MRRDDVFRRLRDVTPLLRQEGVHQLYLFGSTARDTGRPDSDVNLIVEASGPSFVLLELAGVARIATAALGARIDLLTLGSLRPSLRARIEAEAVPVL